MSFIFGAVLPAVIGMLPTWVERKPLRHQNILAAWQLDPVWVALIQALTAYSLCWMEPRSERDDRRAVWWTRATFLLAALSSAAGHLYTMFSILKSSDPCLEFGRIYVPHLFTGPEGSTKRLANGPWLFLQYDLLIIGLSSLSWAYLFVLKLIAQDKIGIIALFVAFVLGDAMIGPGATVSLALWWREGQLQQIHANRLILKEKIDKNVIAR